MDQIVKRVFRKLRSICWQSRHRLYSARRLKNIIVFESSPDLSDNTKAVFDEMLRRGMNRQYKLVYLLYGSDERRPSEVPNVFYLPHWDPQARYYSKAAKVKICCNRFLEKESEGQMVFYLSHGTWLKVSRAHYKVPDWIDWCIAAAPTLEESHAYDANFIREKTIGLGFPRNDILGRANAPIRDALGTHCGKVIVWYPTFRQHSYVAYTTITNPIPLLDDLECTRKLNDAAAMCDTMIVIKPHPMQDTRYIREMNLSHIRFIDDTFFSDHKMGAYEFVGSCDALITDYSSIYYDFTLCDRPIALIWADIETYKVSPGLIHNYEYMTKGGEKIYTLDELTAFVQRVSKGEDLLKAQRREIRDYTNFSADGQNSRRVLDFIIEKSNLDI